MHRYRILVVEDDHAIRNGLADALAVSGYDVLSARDGYEAMEMIHAEEYDLALLDVVLPGANGFELLKRIREDRSTVPVLMLTARSEVSDKVQGLDCGADYYLTKPFEPRELLACVRALIRRQPELRTGDGTLTCGDLRLDKNTFSLICGERSVRLSRKEFDMMELLMLNQKQVLTKETLLLKIWGYESEAETTTWRSISPSCAGSWSTSTPM